MRPSRTTTAPLTALLAAAALATPAAAKPAPQYNLPPHFRTADAHTGAALSSYDLPRGFRTADGADATAGRGTFSAPEVTVVKVPQSAPASDGGVDWADAAIGAGGAAGVLAITLAGAMTLRRRRVATGPRAAVS